MERYSGSCLCGQITYKVEGEAFGFYHCHCRRCRKTTGTGHASNIRVKADGIHWLQGELLINSYKVPDADRFKNDFCIECGSPLPRHFEHMGMVLIPAGTLDMEPTIQPQAHIFEGSRALWSCQDDLPAYEEYPDS